MFKLILETPEDYIQWHEKAACMEQKIDDMTVKFRNNMYEGLRNGICSDEGSILFSEMLTDFERIGDHGLNIANEILHMSMIEMIVDFFKKTYIITIVNQKYSFIF